MDFVSNRDIVVRSSKAGQSVAFKKGIPTYVPDRMHAECLEKGILPVDEKGLPVNPTENTVIVDEKKATLAPDDQDVRELQILEVIEDIVKRNNTKEFTGGGHPSAAAVSAQLGWKTDQHDVSKVWKANITALLGSKKG